MSDDDGEVVTGEVVNIRTKRPWGGTRDPKPLCTAVRRDGQPCEGYAMKGGTLCTVHFEKSGSGRVTRPSKSKLESRETRAKSHELAPLCTAHRKSDGQQCRQYAMRGQKVCQKHGGKAPQNLRKAKTRLAKVEANAFAKRYAERFAQRLVTSAGVNVDPLEHLAYCLGEASGLKLFWMEKVSELDAASDRESREHGFLRGQIHYSETENERDVQSVGTREHLIGLDRHGQALVHPFVAEHKDAIDRHARIAKMCADAGVSERRVQIAEQQGQLLAQVFRGFVADLERMLGVPIGTRPDFPALMRRNMALATG